MSNKPVQSLNLIETFSEFKELKNIDKATMISVLEDSFRSVITKMFGTDESFTVVINPDKGDCEIWRDYEVVADGEVEDPLLQLGYTKAKAIDPECEIGDDVTESVNFLSFGRRAVLTLRQTLASKILELQKESVYDQYKEMIGQVVYGEVYQIWKKEILLLDDQGNELLLPKTEQIPSDFYKKGDTVKAVVVKVDNKNNQLKIIVSRVSEVFLQRLFEQEIPEVQEGTIMIRKIARIPGERAKVAVESYDDRIDPVGSCVGVKGSRIHSIVRELRNENIDVINYTSNLSLFIARSLSPAKVLSIRIDEERKRAEVSIKPEDVSLAIGKGGSNIKLASNLTGYTIEVFRHIDDEDEDDVFLDAFSDEIDPWVIEVFKSIGCDTAKSVLEIPRQELIDRTDLEEETVDDALAILKQEFE